MREPEVDRSQRIERRPVHRPLDESVSAGHASRSRAGAGPATGRRTDRLDGDVSSDPVDRAGEGGGHHEVVDGDDDAERSRHWRMRDDVVDVEVGACRRAGDVDLEVEVRGTGCLRTQRDRDLLPRRTSGSPRSRHCATRVAPGYSRIRMEAFPVPVSERTHAVAV